LRLRISMPRSVNQKFRLIATLLLLVFVGQSVWIALAIEHQERSAARNRSEISVHVSHGSSQGPSENAGPGSRRLLQAHLLSTCVGLVLLLSILRLVDLKMARPLRSLCNVMKRVEEGDTLARFSSMHRDEIGELGAAMNAMLDTIIRNSRQLQEAQSALENKVARLTASEMELHEHKATLHEAVQNRTRELSEVIKSLEAEIQHRKHIEEELRREKLRADALNRSKSEFLANMSHELRTPLNTIIGFTDLLLDKSYGELNASQEEYLTDVNDSAHHLLSVINDILDLSKVEAGKLELDLSEVSVSSLLQHSLIVLKEKALKHQIRITARSTVAPDSMLADERKLKQTLFNLLSNAIKFTPEGGEVTVTAEDFGQGIQFSVADSGIGIKAEDLERIFNPFEQVDSSSTRVFQGTGLGLSLCRSFVALHGGLIWAESEGENCGAVFRFVIPRRASSGLQIAMDTVSASSKV